jgi:hypothetical protein
MWAAIKKNTHELLQINGWADNNEVAEIFAVNY